MNRKQIIDSCLLEFHAMGILSSHEIQVIEELLLKDESLQNEFIDIQNTLQKYAEIYGISPQIHLKENIVKIIEKLGSLEQEKVIEYKKEATIYSLFQKLKSNWISVTLPFLVGISITVLVLIILQF